MAAKKKKKAAKKKVTKKRLTRKTAKKRSGNVAESLTSEELKKISAAALKRRPDSASCELSVDEMKKIRQWTAKEGGFQRDLSTSQVNGVTAFLLYSPVPVLAPIVLAKVKGDRTSKRWCIDGQHRLQGSIQAEMPIAAVTITVDSLEDARYLFLVYNSKSRRVSQRFIGRVSNNAVAVETRLMAKSFGAFYEHIKRLGVGLHGGLTTKYWDEVAHDTKIPQDRLNQMHLIMDIWTDDPRWVPDEFPEEQPGEVTRCVPRKIVESTKSAYCVPGVLQAVGAVVRALDCTTNDQIRTVVEVAQDLPFKRKSFRELAGRNGMDFWCDLVADLQKRVAKHALGK